MATSFLIPGPSGVSHDACWHQQRMVDADNVIQPQFKFTWTDETVDHLAEHRVCENELEEVVSNHKRQRENQLTSYLCS